MDLIKGLEGKDYGHLTAKEFSRFIQSHFLWEKIEKEILVDNRGDGRKGKVDLLVTENSGKRIGIEIDRCSPRTKSIFKLNRLDCDERYIILRSPVKIIQIN